MNTPALGTFLLATLRAFEERGASVGLLTQQARLEVDAQVSEPEVERALRELADARHATPYEQPVLGRRWRITALGRSVLEEAGL